MNNTKSERIQKQKIQTLGPQTSTLTVHIGISLILASNQPFHQNKDFFVGKTMKLVDT